MYAFAPAFVGHADDAAQRHAFEQHDRVLHLGGVDVFPSADDHVLDAIDHGNEAFVVHEAAVARVHPAVAQRRGCFLRTVPVAAHQHRATRADLSDGSRRHGVTAIVDDADLGKQ